MNLDSINQYLESDQFEAAVQGYAIYFVPTVFFLVFFFLFRAFRSGLWLKLKDHYGVNKKPNDLGPSARQLTIKNTRFKASSKVIWAFEKGLYIHIPFSHKLVIPWYKLKNIQKISHEAFGHNFEYFHADISVDGEDVKLTLDSDLVNYAIKNGYIDDIDSM